jgi:hypothetical protein
VVIRIAVRRIKKTIVTLIEAILLSSRPKAKLHTRRPWAKGLAATKKEVS